MQSRTPHLRLNWPVQRKADSPINESSADNTFEEDDDTEYDALNSETFGEDLPASDWEQVHEQLASELEKTHFDDESDDLSQRIASYVLNDEGEEVDANTVNHKTEVSQKETSALSLGSDKWWPNGEPQKTTDKTPMDAWFQKPQATPFASGEAMKMPPKPAKILKLEEVEQQMRQAAAAQSVMRVPGPAHGPKTAPAPPLEDVERDMHHHPNQMQNGHYGRGRHVLARGGRYRSNVPQEQTYHAVHHPFPPYPGTSSMVRPPHPRHQGPPYHHQRYYDNRIPTHHLPGTRPPRIGNHQPYLQNQHPPYGRMGPPPTGPVDEYAGLMSQQEKQWLASIQMMQLNSNQPYQDDYYYLMFTQRQGSGRRMCSGQNQKREQVPTKPASTYTPLQFENSLGKLQIGSVTAPRKIIDMELVEGQDQNNSKQSDKKSKQILLEIEEMYNYVIQIEDAFNVSNSGRHEIDIVGIQDKLVNMVIVEGKLLQYMSIRKGKKVVLRMLPNLLYPGKLLYQLMMDLVPITRKDTENNMLLFLPAIRNYLQNLSLDTLVEITNNYDNQFLLSNKFTVSVMANLIERADQVRNECKDEKVLKEWNLFLLRLLESTRLSNQTERPVVAVARNVLMWNLNPVLDQVTQVEINALLNTLASATPSAPSAEPPSKN